MMAPKKTFLLSLLATLALWALISWPLPRYFFTGVPASSFSTEENPVRRMIPGDHLQLVYNYWVFSDMVTGGTPWFYNLYEFNAGDDAARKHVGGDLIPFSFVYVLGQVLGDRAFAFNLVGLFSLFITFWISWMLVRRYIPDDVISGLAAGIAVALPYRWAALLGGSPTGFAMACIPVLMLGLDMAVRDRSFGGGGLAALAMLTAYWNDAHIFFFGFLFAPPWVVFSYLFHKSFNLFRVREWLGLLVAVAPYLVLMVVLVGLAQVNKAADVPGTTIEAGRALNEVALFSPMREGLLSVHRGGHEQSIYLGLTVLVLALLAPIVLIIRWRVAKVLYRQHFTMLLLAGGLLIIVLLALGVHGPLEGLPLRVARRLLPHYDMIRQPAKIYALVPPLLALLTGYAAWVIFGASKRRWFYFAGCMALAWVVFDYSRQIKPSICLMDFEQGAYRAVQDDAVKNGVAPRSIAIPLWPGDSAWSSLYQHYGSLYRIRMVNGYLPVVPVDYIERVANRYAWVNSGLLKSEKLDELLEKGIGYLLLHENAFPEQVSAYGVSFTLFNLLSDRRLELLHQDQSVWAFKILSKDKDEISAYTSFPLFSPTRNAHRQFEQFQGEDLTIERDDDASNGAFARIIADQGFIEAGEFPHGGLPGSSLLVRFRGDARLVITFEHETGAIEERRIDVASSSWDWRNIPYEAPADSRSVKVAFAVTSGSIDLDMMIYAVGTLPDLREDESFELPASALFHAGYSDAATGFVHLRPEYEPDGDGYGVVYGPNLPIRAGNYSIEMIYETEAPPGILVGSLFMANEFNRTEVVDVVSGQTASIYLPSSWGNMSFSVFFDYTRLYPVQVQSLRITGR